MLVVVIISSVLICCLFCKMIESDAVDRPVCDWLQALFPLVDAVATPSALQTCPPRPYIFLRDLAAVNLQCD